jgi:hypothetical protein
MRTLSKKELVMAGLFTLVALFPFATATSGRTMISLPLAALTPHEGLRAQEQNMQTRRQAGELRRICDKRGGECPDINDKTGLRRFLKGKPIRSNTGASMNASAGSGSVKKGMLRIIDLSDLQESMLRRFIRVRACPDGLDELKPGFGALCNSLIRQQRSIFHPLLNDKARIEFDKNEDRATLDDIVEMFEGARPDR